MKLDDLLKGVSVVSVQGQTNIEVSRIAYDSRQVAPGGLFVAMRGEFADGNDFVPQARNRGAVCVVSERAPSASEAGASLTWIRVPSARVALAELASRFFNDPTRELCLVGITGTNGKTTTAHLVESIFRAAGHAVVLLGTTGYRGPGFDHRASLTTPEAPEIERWFRESVGAGGTHAVMEVSSHAIAMSRVWGLDFNVAVFTNLSREHLDFHGTLEEYFEVKKRLFDGLGTPPPRIAVVNGDDPYGRRLQDCGNQRWISFGVGMGETVGLREAELGWAGSAARFSVPDGMLEVRSRLIGRTNLYNIAAAIGVAIGLEVDPDSIARGISGLAGVPGRFERVDRGQQFQVVVDYAHTDDALRQVLTTARELTDGRVIVVFGAGGERDTAKRRRMGEVAARLSDLQFVTSDNPRGEEPRRIIRMIEEGLEAESGKYSSIPERRDAIRAALREAGPGDTVVIAGKGHETTQVVGSTVLPFDDREVAAELLDELDASGNS